MKNSVVGIDELSKKKPHTMMVSCSIEQLSSCLFHDVFQRFVTIMYSQGAKGNCDFGISDLVKNPDETDKYLTPLVNFGEVRRAQLAKSTLLTSSLVPVGSFQIF